MMDEQQQLRIQVSEAAMRGIKAAIESGGIPEEVHESVVLEGLLLTMQMVGGPQATATVLRYSFDIFAVK